MDSQSDSHHQHEGNIHQDVNVGALPPLDNESHHVDTSVEAVNDNSESEEGDRGYHHHNGGGISNEMNLYNPFHDTHNAFPSQDGDYPYHVSFPAGGGTTGGVNGGGNEESGKSEKKEKNFADVINEFIVPMEGQIYVDFEPLLRRFQQRKRNASHYKLNLSEVIEKNQKKYMPLKHILRFFESSGFTHNKIYESWKVNLMEQAILARFHRKDRKRKRTETYDISPLGLMSACECATSMVVPKKTRLAVKPLNVLTDTHYAKSKASQLIDTMSKLLSNLKQNFDDVIYFKATSDLEWFKQHLIRFWNTAPRCQTIVRDVINEKKAIPDTNQRKAVTALKGLKDKIPGQDEMIPEDPQEMDFRSFPETM